MASLHSTLQFRKPALNIRHYHLCSRHPKLNSRVLAPVFLTNAVNNNFIFVRTIVYNEKLVERGINDKFGSGFAKDGGLDKFGTFPEMEQFMTDYIPDLTVNVVPVLQELSLHNAWPSVVIAHMFNNLQIITGLPWYASIGLLAVTVKLSLYPFHIWWRKEFQEHVKASPIQLAHFLKAYFSNVIQHGPEEGIKQAYQARRETCKELNLPLYPNLFPIYVTILVPISAAIALSYLTNLTYAPLMTGGLLWFPNLAEPDPYYVLPVLNSLLIIANSRFHPFGLLLPKPVFLLGFKFQAPLGILTVLQLWCSSALLMYWISANSVGLIIQLLLRTTTVRELHGLENKIHLFKPLLQQSASFKSLGDQIESTKTQLIEIKKEELQLLSDISSNDENKDLNLKVDKQTSL